MNNNTCFVLICGSVGSGKTTLTKILGKHLNWKIIIENPDDYPYLVDFHLDKEKYSFRNQLSFIFNKFKNIDIYLRSSAETIVQDQGGYDCYEIYSKKLLDDGFMDLRDFQVLSEFYSFITSSLRIQPSLIVHLMAPPEILLQRIYSRAREFEMKSIDYSFLADLEKRYQNWVNKITYCPVIEIDTGRVDLIQNVKDIEFTVTKIYSEFQKCIANSF